MRVSGNRERFAATGFWRLIPCFLACDLVHAADRFADGLGLTLRFVDAALPRSGRFVVPARDRLARSFSVRAIRSSRARNALPKARVRFSSSACFIASAV